MTILHRPAFLLLYMLLGAAVPLGFALFVQYVQHYPPCHFCLYQRYPYLLIFALLLFTIPGLNYAGWIRFQALLAVLAWLVTSGLGFYHFGIEQGVIPYQGACVSEPLADNSIEALKAQIEAAPLVACNETSWEFFGLSMPFWNGVTGLVLALGMLYMLRLQRRQA
jgi:disulfide bond formation protein DsbB